MSFNTKNLMCNLYVIEMNVCPSPPLSSRRQWASMMDVSEEIERASEMAAFGAHSRHNSFLFHSTLIIHFYSWDGVRSGRESDRFRAVQSFRFDNCQRDLSQSKWHHDHHDGTGVAGCWTRQWRPCFVFIRYVRIYVLALARGVVRVIWIFTTK